MMNKRREEKSWFKPFSLERESNKRGREKKMGEDERNGWMVRG